MVMLPASLLKENSELPLVIEHLGLGVERTNVWRGLLSINNESIWRSRLFGQNGYTEEPVRIKIKTAVFKPGLKTLHFSLQTGVNASVRSYTITALRFDLPDLARYRDGAGKAAARTDDGDFIFVPR